jgi:hypothetical protein
MIDVAAWRQKDSMTVHLVNLTNPMMMKPPIRDIFPVGVQRVRLRLPDGAGADGETAHRRNRAAIRRARLLARSPGQKLENYVF